MAPVTWHKKGIALNPQSQVHYMDHLAVVAILMDIPYLCLDEDFKNLAEKYYPGLKVLCEDYDSFSLEYVIQRFDVSFLSDLWNREIMHEKFADLEKKYHKKWRNVHCPHGFSDKAFYLCKAAMEDVTLTYGQNMIDQFKDFGVWENIHRYVISGNYRYSYYLQHQDFFDAIFKNEIASRFDKERPIILYAPTWLDSEQSTSFFEACSHLLDQLPSDYNIVVKLHPRLELDDVVNVHRIIGDYEHKENIYFLTDFPLVFPLLAHTDIYIGDTSSIGYDFLIFDKPLFLLNCQRRERHTHRQLLFHCATEILPEQYHELFDAILEGLKNDAQLSSLRKQMWHYTFGPQRGFEEIRADIIKACE